MNSLFSEVFWKFGGVFLEVFKTILGWIWAGFAKKKKGKLPRTNQKKKIPLHTIIYYSK